jgi:hypothetical protein
MSSDGCRHTLSSTTSHPTTVESQAFLIVSPRKYKMFKIRAGLALASSWSYNTSFKKIRDAAACENNKHMFRSRCKKLKSMLMLDVYFYPRQHATPFYSTVLRHERLELVSLLLMSMHLQVTMPCFGVCFNPSTVTVRPSASHALVLVLLHRPGEDSKGLLRCCMRCWRSVGHLRIVNTSCPTRSCYTEARRRTSSLGVVG